MHADVGFLGVAIAGLLKPSARMRSEGYCSRSVSVCVCVCVCVSTLILALQATRWPISDTNGFRTTRA